MHEASFDKIIKGAMEEDSRHLEVPAGMLEKVRTGMKAFENARAFTVSGPYGRKLVPVALCLVSIMSVLFFISPEMRVWAAESINSIYIAVKGENGYRIEAREVLGVINGSDYIIRQETNGDVVDTTVFRNTNPEFRYTTLGNTELTEKLGYEVKLSDTLPFGFTLKNKRIAGTANNSILLCQYSAGTQLYVAATDFPLNIRDDKEANQVKIGNVTGFLLERAVRLTAEGEVIFSLAEKPDRAAKSNILVWQDAEVSYAIMDSSNMPEEQLIEMALTIMNTK